MVGQGHHAFNARTRHTNGGGWALAVVSALSALEEPFDPTLVGDEVLSTGHGQHPIEHHRRRRGDAVLDRLVVLVDRLLGERDLPLRHMSQEPGPIDPYLGGEIGQGMETPDRTGTALV